MSETKADRRHTAANDTDLTLNNRPQTGLKVVPGHISSVGEVDEGSKSEY